MAEPGRPRILVLEDEWLIADLLRDMLTDLGYEVIGPAGDVEEALELIRQQTPSAAVLDVSVGEDKSFAVADAMSRRGAPFMFVTGYMEDDLPSRYRNCPVIRKPVTLFDLQAPLARIVETAGPSA